MKLTFEGAARTVTGSCFHLAVNGMELLVDCGMHQGRGSREANRAPFPFDVSALQHVLLTHAHIDHSGLLPRLVKEGFSGSIIATPATADLSDVMLADSAHIQESEALWLNKKAARAGDDTVHEPLYTIEDARAASGLFDRKAYGAMGHLGKSVKYRFVDAGHILGSGSLELWYQDGPAEKKIVFSGDIGKRNNPIVRDPQTIPEANYVVMESTYGNRVHKGMDESIAELAQAVRDTFRRGGNVIIPSFAVGRTQDLLYIMHMLGRKGRLDPVDVYVDSPLAEEATDVYLKHPDVFDEDALKLLRTRGGNGIRVKFTKTVEESQRLNSIKSGIVIIAGSGMCEGGRIRHHLKHNLWRRESSIVFVGYQAEGTLGREIVDRAKKVEILGEPIAVRAAIHTIGGFSAHAGKDELISWLKAFVSGPQVFIVHGEEQVTLEFAESVRKETGLKASVPVIGDSFDI